METGTDVSLLHRRVSVWRQGFEFVFAARSALFLETELWPQSYHHS